MTNEQNSRTLRSTTAAVLISLAWENSPTIRITIAYSTHFLIPTSTLHYVFQTIRISPFQNSFDEKRT